MKKKAVAYSIVFILVAGVLCSCGETPNKKVTIQLSVLRDVLSWNDGVVWNTESDVLIKRIGESSEKSIFQDPFYEKEEEEEVVLQYIDEGQLYYIRTFEEKYYELCSMDLDTFKETVLYANCSPAQRKYDYLGIKDKMIGTADERGEISKNVIRQFCKIDNVIYMMDEDTLYEMNQWTKYKRVIDDNLDSDTELVFIDSKIYYKNEDEHLMEYDRKTGEKLCLSDWMVQKLCFCGGDLLVQRMNGETYCCYSDGRLEKLEALSGRLIQGDENYCYYLEEDGGKLVVYDADTLHPLKVIRGENIWGVAEMVGDVLYYLEAADECLLLRETGPKG